MTKIWAKFSESEFLRNVSSQMIGTALAQALPFLATPILTRLFTEDDFAMYTSFFAVASIFAVAVGGKYHLAIVLPKKEEDANKLFSLSVYLTVAYAIILGIVFPFFIYQFSPKLGSALYYVPLYVLFFGIWSSYINLSIRRKTFKTNAFAKVLQSVGYILVAIGLGFTKILLFGLVIAKLAGTLFSFIFLSKKSTNQFTFGKLAELKEVAKTYKDYPKFGIWPSLLNTISLQALVLVLAKFYTTEDLGHYGLTFMVLSAPLGLIGASYKDVFYQKIATLANSNNYSKAVEFFNKSAVALFAMGVPICLILYFFGEPLFELIFGQQWSRAGAFSSILAFSFLIKLVVSPLSSIFNATNTLRIASRWQVLYFITTFLTLGYCAYFLKMEITLLLTVYVIHEIILYAIYFWWQKRALKSFIPQKDNF